MTTPTPTPPASALPWTLDDIDWPLIVNEGATGAVIATVPLPPGSEGDDEAGKTAAANAALIVIACNAHAALTAEKAALVAALREIIAEANDMLCDDDEPHEVPDPGVSVCGPCKIHTKATAAIAAAGQEA